MIISGNAGNDILSGNRNSDTIFGNDGDDRLIGGFDDDFLEGGVGSDRVSGAEGNDTLIGVDATSPESLFGQGERDILVGNRRGDSTGSEFPDPQQILKLDYSFCMFFIITSEMRGTIELGGVRKTPPSNCANI